MCYPAADSDIYIIQLLQICVMEWFAASQCGLLLISPVPTRLRYRNRGMKWMFSPSMVSQCPIKAYQAAALWKVT
jgi:hypothetical protein